MPTKNKTTRVKKHPIAKLPVRILNKKNPLRQLADDGKEELIVEDLLPESREFLEEKETDIRPQIKEAPVYTEEILEKEEKYKTMVMWSGISFFMILILVAWGFNMKSVFRETAAKTSGNKAADQSWDDLSKELTKVMATWDEKTNELKGVIASTTRNVLPTDEPLISSSSINELKNKLETATGTVKN